MEEITELPASFPAGKSYLLRRSYSKHPASEGWTLSLAIKGASALELTADADGDDFLFSIHAAATEDLIPGGYEWQERADLGTARDFPASGRVVITADLFAAAAGDRVTWREARLAKIDALIAAREADAMTAELTEWSLQNRLGRRPDLPRLYKLRQQCERAVARERGERRTMRTAEVHFTPGAA